MTVLDRYYLKELLYNLAFTLAVLSSVFFIVGAVKALHDFPDLDLWLLLRALPFFLLYRMEFVLPLSLLIAVVLVYGKSAANHEITTVKASGIHPYRVLLPALALALVVANACLVLAFEWTPRADVLFKRSLATQESLKRLFENTISRNRRHVDVQDLSILWKSESYPEAGGLVLTDVLCELPLPGARKEEARISVLKADSIRVQFDAQANVISLTIPSGEFLEGPTRGQRFTDQTIQYRVGDTTAARRLKFQTGAELMSQYQRSREGLNPRYPPEKLMGEFHARISLATSPLFFVLIGAPLALVFRAGNRLVAFLISFLMVLFVFYPCHLMAQTLTEQQILHPVVAAWSGSALLFVLGTGLLVFVVRK